MKPSEIIEKESYTDDPTKLYWRTVEFVFPATDEPELSRFGGDAWCFWHTDGFEVKAGGHTHGQCRVSTFAAWAKVKLSSWEPITKTKEN